MLLHLFFYPNFIGLVVDEEISKNNFKTTFLYSALMILVSLITVLSEYISSVSYDKFYLEMRHEMKSKENRLSNRGRR